MNTGDNVLIQSPWSTYFSVDFVIMAIERWGDQYLDFLPSELSAVWFLVLIYVLLMVILAIFVRGLYNVYTRVLRQYVRKIDAYTAAMVHAHHIGGDDIQSFMKQRHQTKHDIRESQHPYYTFHHEKIIEHMRASQSHQQLQQAIGTRSYSPQEVQHHYRILHRCMYLYRFFQIIIAICTIGLGLIVMPRLPR